MRKPPFATVKAASLLPIHKVGYSAVVGAAVSIGVYIAKQNGIEIPPDVAASITLLATSLVAYFVPIQQRELKDD
jgi:hypothetical protein